MGYKPSGAATLPTPPPKLDIPAGTSTAIQQGLTDRQLPKTPSSALRTGARSERIPRSQYVLNEGVSINVQKTPASLAARTPQALPFGGVFSFIYPDSSRLSARPQSPGSPGRPTRMEDCLKVEEIEKKHAVSVTKSTPRGETPMPVNKAKALTAFFDQFCELSA